MFVYSGNYRRTEVALRNKALHRPTWDYMLFGFAYAIYILKIINPRLCPVSSWSGVKISEPISRVLFT